MRSANCDRIIHLYYIIVALDYVSTVVFIHVNVPTDMHTHEKNARCTHTHMHTQVHVYVYVHSPINVPCNKYNEPPLY